MSAGGVREAIMEEAAREKAMMKPCPFCGVVPWGIQHHAPEWEPVQYYINCENNKCPVEDVRSGWFKSKEEAVEAWNRRVKDEDNH